MKIPRQQCSFSSRLILVRSQSRHALHTSRISTTIQRQLRRISTIHKYTDECKSKYSTHSVVVANLTKRNFVLFENGKSKHDHPKTIRLIAMHLKSKEFFKGRSSIVCISEPSLLPIILINIIPTPKCSH